MRLKIRHETSYSYDQPAIGAIQVLRLTPRHDSNQFVRRWRVEIDADARLHRDEDAFGNITHVHSIDGAIDGLKVTVEGEVDTFDLGGNIGGTLERLPLGFYLSRTRLTAPDAAIRQFAVESLAEEGGDRLAFLHTLMVRLYRDWLFSTEATQVTTTAAESFAAKAGVCQDFAQLFVSAARVAGIPARYVSGYYFRTDSIEQEAGHAWAEAHVEGLGWIGFDPSHGCCTGPRYVRLAVGRDALEAAPIRGMHAGGAGESLSVAVQVAQGRMIVDA